MPAVATLLLKTRQGCRRHAPALVALYRNATHTVFGEASARPPIMLVGEQPGAYIDDLAAFPSAGPAGKCSTAPWGGGHWTASKFYLTNAVKHFKNEPRWKERLHKAAQPL